MKRRIIISLIIILFSSFCANAQTSIDDKSIPVQTEFFGVSFGCSKNALIQALFDANVNYVDKQGQVLARDILFGGIIWDEASFVFWSDSFASFVIMKDGASDIEYEHVKYGLTTKYPVKYYEEYGAYSYYDKDGNDVSFMYKDHRMMLWYKSGKSSEYYRKALDEF